MTGHISAEKEVLGYFSSLDSAASPPFYKAEQTVTPLTAQQIFLRTSHNFLKGGVGRAKMINQCDFIHIIVSYMDS